MKAILIDPRGYFGKTKLYGDEDYDYRDEKAPNAKREFDRDIERLKKYISEIL